MSAASLLRARIAVSDARRELIEAQERWYLAIATDTAALETLERFESRLAGAEAALAEATRPPWPHRWLTRLTGRSD